MPPFEKVLISGFQAGTVHKRSSVTVDRFGKTGIFPYCLRIYGTGRLQPSLDTLPNLRERMEAVNELESGVKSVVGGLTCVESQGRFSLVGHVLFTYLPGWSQLDMEFAAGIVW